MYRVFIKAKIKFKNNQAIYKKMNLILLPFIFLSFIILFSLSSPAINDTNDFYYKDAVRILEKYALIDGYNLVKSY
jgi:hypothetical protein